LTPRLPSATTSVTACSVMELGRLKRNSRCQLRYPWSGSRPALVPGSSQRRSQTDSDRRLTTLLLRPPSRAPLHQPLPSQLHPCANRMRRVMRERGCGWWRDKLATTRQLSPLSECRRHCRAGLRLEAGQVQEGHLSLQPQPWHCHLSHHRASPRHPPPQAVVVTVVAVVAADPAPPTLLRPLQPRCHLRRPPAAQRLHHQHHAASKQHMLCSCTELGGRLQVLA